MSYFHAELRIELYAGDKLVASVVDDERWEELFLDLLAMERRALKDALLADVAEEEEPEGEGWKNTG